MLAAKAAPGFMANTTPAEWQQAPHSVALPAIGQELTQREKQEQQQQQQVYQALNEDLVASTVRLDAMARRLELTERGRERLHADLQEAQARRQRIPLLAHTAAAIPPAAASPLQRPSLLPKVL